MPREMLGLSTFGVSMALLRWLPLRLVDQFLCGMAHLLLGDTDRLGLRRPKTGPIELKNLTGKTPVLDVGALAQIKSGNIKVHGFSVEPLVCMPPLDYSPSKRRIELLIHNC